MLESKGYEHIYSVLPSNPVLKHTAVYTFETTMKNLVFTILTVTR